MIDFTTLQNRYIFEGQLELLEAIHIGSGVSDERTDSPFVKYQKNGEFYIPGSSLRGVLRSLSERLVYSLWTKDRAKKSCLLDTGGSSNCITVNKATQNEFQKKIETGEKEEKLLEWLGKNGRLCTTCKLYGSTHIASKVKITDLRLSKKDKNGTPLAANNPNGVIRYSVAIDRDTETAKEGALFDIEVLEQGYLFDFEAIAENLDNDDLGLLALGLNEMIRGNFYIGAKSAAGLGRCKLLNLHIYYFDQDKEFNLKRYLEKGELGTVAVDFLQQKLENYLEGIQ